MLADLRSQLLDDWRSHWLGRRLSTKRGVLTNLLGRNILRRRLDSTTTPGSDIVRRSGVSRLVVGHVETRSSETNTHSVNYAKNTFA